MRKNRTTFASVFESRVSKDNSASDKENPGCSSAWFRVRVWGAWGRKFKSCHPDGLKMRRLDRRV